MGFLSSLIIFMFAGAINGSFALPSVRLKNWSFDRIWLNYSFWGFLIFPCFLVTVFSPIAWRVYTQASFSLLSIIFAGGFLFGVGQIFFSRALHSIGLSLGFLINISVGTALGSLIPLIMLNSRHILTFSGLATVASILFIIAGVTVSYFAGYLRDQQIENTFKNNYYISGIFFAVIAGLFSAGQNVTFSLTHTLQTHALQLGVNHLIAANIIWPGFLIATFIPYAGYMLYLRFKSKNTNSNFKSFDYYFSTMIMGAFWYFSLILYSDASLKIGALGPVIGWPLFMVCIILTANMWGFHNGEWKSASLKAKRLAKQSILLLILAIIILAYTSSR